VSDALPAAPDAKPRWHRFVALVTCPNCGDAPSQSEKRKGDGEALTAMAFCALQKACFVKKTPFWLFPIRPPPALPAEAGAGSGFRSRLSL